VSKDENCIPHGTYSFPLKSDAYPSINSDKSIRCSSLRIFTESSVKFYVQKSPNVHKSMLLRGAILKPRTLNEMDIETMRRHAATHDRIQNQSWQNRNSPRNGGYQARTNGNSNYGNSMGYGNSRGSYDNSQGGQHMKVFPPAPTPGVPPSNIQASQWYQQTSQGGTSPAHNSGILRLEDLQTHFGNIPPARGGYQNRGGGYGGNPRGNDRGGNGYYGNRENRSGSGSGYRDNRWR